MKFKIKHETFFYLIVSLISMSISLMFLSLNTDACILICLAFFVVADLFIVFHIIEHIAGITIVIQDKTVIIKSFLKRRKIAVSEISNLHIEKYSRYRHKPSAHTEYRMRMTIELFNNKKIVLTDNATAVNNVEGFLLSKYEEAPDEDVSLYKAYQIIKCEING